MSLKVEGTTMIAQGKTLEEIRDRSHPFGQALQELYDTCDLVCSAPMVAILAGEHAGVDGALMLVAPLPMRVYVGTLGRNVYGHGSPPPMLSSFRYYDAPTDELHDRSHNPEYLGAEENIRNIAALLTETAKDQHFKFLPAEIVVLSEASPGRGANWSGAFSTAVALALYLLQGKKDFPEQLYAQSWKNISQIPKRDQDIERLFRIALKIECISHSLASGYGPACSLLPALGGLFIYKGFIDPDFANARGDPHRNAGFFLCHWDTYQQRLTTTTTHRLSDLYDILLIDSGRSKSTADSIGRVRGSEEANLAQDIVNLLFREDPNQLPDALANSRSYPDRMLRNHRIGMTTLSVSSALAVKTLRDCCGGIEDPKSILRVIYSIDNTHRRLGLSFAELDQIRIHFEEAMLHHHIGIKLTGGGRGGDIVLWGTTEAVSNITLQELDRKRPQPTLIWQLSRDGLAHEGAVCNRPYPFQAFDDRAMSFPSSRIPTRHQATVLYANGKKSCVPAEPEFLFRVYLKLREIALGGTCLYLYYFDDPSKDRFEPLYLSRPERSGTGTLTLMVFPIHHEDGSKLLKELLVSFAQQGQLSLDNPASLFETGGKWQDYAGRGLEAARAALNEPGNKIKRQESDIAFPHLVVHQPRSVVQDISLKLPENSCLFIIRPCNQSIGM